MEPSHLSYEVVARAQMKVVGVREDHRRAHLREIARIQRLDGCQRSHGHESGSLHVTMRCREDPAARGSGASVYRERETQVRCPMSDVRYPIPDTRCPMPDTRYPIPANVGL